MATPSIHVFAPRHAFLPALSIGYGAADDSIDLIAKPGGKLMKLSSAFRAAVLALVAFAGLSSAASADEGYVQLTIYKGGWIIGGNGGGGVLDFHGRRYSLWIGGTDFPSSVAACP